MTVDEAIEGLVGLADSETAGVDEYEKEAIGLGIAALKRLKNGGHLSLDELLKPLPGETEGWERRPKRRG